MKIEIDLNDILHDELGSPSETLAQSVRRQAIAAIVEEVRKDAAAEIKAAVAQAVTAAIEAWSAEHIPLLAEQMLDLNYTPKGRFGETAAPTTMRQEIHAHLLKGMVFEQRGYSNEKNSFTRAVEAAVSAKMADFQKEWTRTVDAHFLRDAMAHAVKSLSERLGIKAG